MQTTTSQLTPAGQSPALALAAGSPVWSSENTVPNGLNYWFDPQAVAANNPDQADSKWCCSVRGPNCGVIAWAEGDDAMQARKRADAICEALNTHFDGVQDTARLDWMLENVGKHYAPVCSTREEIDEHR